MKIIDLSRGMVFITGAGGSIGGAIAKEAAAAGAAVALGDNNLLAAQTIADEIISSGGKAKAFQVDVTKSESIHSAMAEAATELGPMIGLVCAAAILRTGPVATQSEQGWQEIMAVNVEGTFKAVQASVSYLEKTKGAIVTLGSVSAFIGSEEGAAYTATKGAVLSFTYASAGDLAPRGIRVNAVSPGWVDGGFTHQAMSEMENPEQLVETAKRMHYLGRMATPQDVANAAVWLLSDQAAFVTGTSLLVDGGYMIKRG